MEFDDSNQELQRIAREAFARIPEDARRLIESVCRRVTFVANGDSEGEFLPVQQEIQVVLSRIGDFSVRGKRGVLAHEFGHAYIWAKGYRKSGETAETLANMVAQQWQFLTDLDAMKADTIRLRRS